MRSRLVACVLTLSALLTASTAARADARHVEMAGTSVTWDSKQLPDARWKVDWDMQLPALVNNGDGWAFLFGGPLTLSLTTLGDTATLDPTGMHINIGSPLFMWLSEGERLRISFEPVVLDIRSESVFKSPEHAQLAISLGRNELSARVEEGADTVASAGSLLATPSGLLSGLSVSPSLSGIDPHALLDGLDLTLSAHVTGGYHLTSSPDPTCVSLDCMVGQRASATLRRIDIAFLTTYDIVNVSSVPEPSSWALWLVAWTVGRRLKRGDDELRSLTLRREPASLAEGR